MQEDVFLPQQTLPMLSAISTTGTPVVSLELVGKCLLLQTTLTYAILNICFLRSVLNMLSDLEEAMKLHGNKFAIRLR